MPLALLEATTTPTMDNNYPLAHHRGHNIHTIVRSVIIVSRNMANICGVLFVSWGTSVSQQTKYFASLPPLPLGRSALRFLLSFNSIAPSLSLELRRRLSSSSRNLNKSQESDKINASFALCCFSSTCLLILWRQISSVFYILLLLLLEFHENVIWIIEMVLDKPSHDQVDWMEME